MLGAQASPAPYTVAVPAERPRCSPPPPPHAGNLSLARELLKCAVKADPKSEASWLVWAQMEEDLGYYQRASELRSYSMQVGGIAVVALLRAEGYFQRASEQRSYSMQAQQ